MRRNRRNPQLDRDTSNGMAGKGPGHIVLCPVSENGESRAMRGSAGCFGPAASMCRGSLGNDSRRTLWRTMFRRSRCGAWRQSRYERCRQCIAAESTKFTGLLRGDEPQRDCDIIFRLTHLPGLAEPSSVKECPTTDGTACWTRALRDFALARSDRKWPPTSCLYRTRPPDVCWDFPQARFGA